MNNAPFGFVVDGNADCPRTFARADEVFRLACAGELVLNRGGEGYGSAFDFPADLAAHMNANGGSVEGYAGPTSSSWLWFDFDLKADPAKARRDAAQLIHLAADRYDLDADGILAFHTGGKGCHVGLPGTLFGFVAHRKHNDVAQELALNLASAAHTATQDSGVYNRDRLWRLPNSRHASGHHKVRVPADRIGELSDAAVARLAAQPIPFEVPDQPGVHPVAVADHAAALRRLVERQRRRAWTAATVADRDAAPKPPAPVNGEPPGDWTPYPATVDMLAYPCPEGHRHHRLFAVGANLAEATDRATVCATLTGIKPPIATQDQRDYAEAFASIAAGHVPDDILDLAPRDLRPILDSRADHARLIIAVAAILAERDNLDAVDAARQAARGAAKAWRG